MASYYPEFPRDFKAKGKPGNGYLLSEVNGMPYWTDAIGQIPFAVDKFTDELLSTGSYEKAERNTIEAGKQFGDGFIFGESDESNSYDNAMIVRAIKWAKNRYKVITAPTAQGSYNKLEKTSHSPNNLSKSSDEKQ